MNPEISMPVSEKTASSEPGAVQDGFQNCQRHGVWQEIVIDERGHRRAFPGCPRCAREKVAQDLLQRAAIPLRFHDRTLDTFVASSPGHQTALAAARDYVEHFDDVRRTGRCLVLLGNPGNGKTHLAAGIAHDLIKAGHSVMFARAYEIINAIRATWSGNGDEDKVVSGFADVDLLIIDEVGVQYGKEGETIELFKVINRRYDIMAPMIVISNHDLEGVQRYLGTRSFDRLREGGGRVVVFDWESHRKGN